MREDHFLARGVTPEAEAPDLQMSWERFRRNRQLQPQNRDSAPGPIIFTLPEDLREKWQAVKEEKGGSLEEYIISLIRKDLDVKD